MYKSTGIQCSSKRLSASSLSLCGSIYLKKYQEDPADPGIVDVSLFPSGVFTHSVAFSRGEAPVLLGL